MAAFIQIKMPDNQDEGTVSTIANWLKQAGAVVSAHEPLVEIDTDKVSMEVAAPADGILREIHKRAGDEVKPGEILGLLAPMKTEEAHAEAVSTPTPQEQNSQRRSADPRRCLSPSVRRLLVGQDLNPDDIPGTGRGGRITYRDAAAYIQNLEHQQPQTAAAPSTASSSVAATVYPASGIPGRLIPHDSKRRRIADHMVDSMRSAPHVTSVFEMDLSALINHRTQNKEPFRQQGVHLTYTAYFVCASVAALQAVPQVNSRFHEKALEIFDHINIGVGTALEDKGLIVPVIHQAQHLGLLGTATRLQELIAKARQGGLVAADIQNGTFTISNHGVSGSLLAAPIIINQPQAAILGIGKLQKRVVVVDVGGGDAIQIRPMAYVTLSIDHRALDAFHANAFLSKFVEVIENWS